MKNLLTKYSQNPNTTNQETDLSVKLICWLYGILANTKGVIMLHNQPHEFANKKVILKDFVEHPQFGKIGGKEITVEDYWDRVAGISWMDANGNPACLVYAMRTGFSKEPIPIDNEVLYGKLGGLGVLVHTKEIAKISA